RYGESLARRGLLTQAQQDEMTARYRDWLDSCQKREPQPLKPANIRKINLLESFCINWLCEYVIKCQTISVCSQ
uniref:hypothetical protein n=1 Tax=Escherichia coli TaxID=562 RepID=UPI0019670589